MEWEKEKAGDAGVTLYVFRTHHLHTAGRWVPRTVWDCGFRTEQEKVNGIRYSAEAGGHLWSPEKVSSDLPLVRQLGGWLSAAGRLNGEETPERRRSCTTIMVGGDDGVCERKRRTGY